MGPWTGAGWVPGIALPATHPLPYHPGYTSPHGYSHDRACGASARPKVVVGLISVDQLSLCLRISGFQGITEGYNLPKIGRINNHSLIPGTEKAGVSNPWTGPVSAQQPSIKPYIYPILDHRISEVWDIGVWRASRDQSGVWVWRSILGLF